MEKRRKGEKESPDFPTTTTSQKQTDLKMLAFSNTYLHKRNVFFFKIETKT